MKKVLLVSMPFGAPERQALGLSLFKARFAEDGVPCDVRYLTLTFADLIGMESYLWVVHELPHTAFAGEWLFREALFGDDPRRDEQYIQETLRGTWRLNEDDIARLCEIRALVPHFLDYCLEAIPWDESLIVGFTSTFEQNIPSLALARRIKQAHPSLPIAFGGGNWEDEMGVEQHRQFPWVDFVCPGEADETFPALVRHLASGRGSRTLAAIPGLVYRTRNGTRYTGRARLITEMDRLPIPDYSDYFEQLSGSASGSLVVPTLLFEGSRGCWWGATSHCTFCGLNGSTMKFRGKSPDRVLREVDHLVSTWGIDTIQAVDNIMDMHFFKTVLPALAELESPLSFFYEIKSNLERHHVELLAAAGVRMVQPGIESLSDGVLRLMRKGTTALQNLQLLKWCKEYDIAASWNLLHGFPGETKAHYDEMLAMFPAIAFLGAPTACGPVRLDRFSPYFTRAAEFGLTHVRPMKVYQQLYPLDPESLGRIAYYFDYDYEPEKAPNGCSDEVVKAAGQWSDDPEKGSLVSVQGVGGELKLLDDRRSALRSSYRFAGLDRDVYDYCDRARSRGSVHRFVCESLPESGLSEEQIGGFLDWLVAQRLMVTMGGKYLSLAIGSPPADVSGAS
ncbi:MAG: RiPP maturation radical SAM protein 1 [bacterium]|nr:RiPP maturation radical SAM protein 1 [bacterium]